MLDGFFFAGELRYFWRDVLGDLDRCGCGRAYSSCSVWRQVRDELRDLDRERMLQLDGRLLVTRRLARAGGDSQDAREYRAALHRLYTAIGAATGSRILVDTSKAPSYALALARLEGVRLAVVHVVRDPRATTFSRLRDPDPDDTGLAGSALLWGVWNVLTERWFAHRPGYVCVRHEDFAVRPRETVQRILESIDEAPSTLPVTADGRAVLPENHSVAGNSARFRIGEVQIACDDAWERSLPGRHRALAGALTWPVRRRYGYGAGEHVSSAGSLAASGKT